MTSRSDVQNGRDQYLRLEVGQQVLVSQDSLRPSVAMLPPAAYGNLLVVSPKTPGAIADLIDDIGGDIGRVGHIPLASTPTSYDGPMWTGKAVEPGDLTGLSMQFTRALSGLVPEHGWVLFDDFNTLLAYNESEQVVDLLNHLTRKARERDIRGVYSVVEAAMPEQTYRALQTVTEQRVEQN